MKQLLWIIMAMPCLFFSNVIFAQEEVSAQHFTLEYAVNPGTYLRNANTIKASDGGYYRVGTSGDADFSKAIVSKLDADLNPEWAYRVNFTLNEGFSFQASYGADLIEQEDGSILLLIAGNMSAFTNGPAFQNLDYVLIKFTPGETPMIEFAQCYGGSNADIPHSIQTTSDGGYIISGYSNPEHALNAPSISLTYVVKLDENLDLSWDQRIKPAVGECRTDGYTLYNQGMLRRDLVETQDGGYVFTMQCNENTYIAKIDVDGNQVWVKSFASAGGVSNGDFNEDWGFLLGAGGGGALAKVKELANGNLVFIGNQVYFFFAAFGINLEDPDGGADGISLPMTYLFVTNAEGDFQYGTAYFKEAFASQNLPVELLAEDIEILGDDRFLLAAKIDRFVQNNVHSYTPAFMEVSANTSEYDEGLHSMYKLREDEGLDHHRQRMDDYAWGLDQLQLTFNRPNEEFILTYDDHLFKIDGLSYVDELNNCIEQVPDNWLHSFPFTLDFSDMSLIGTPLTSTPISIHSLSSRDFDLEENCSEILVDAVEIPDSENLPKLRTTLVNDQFQLQSPSDWIGADISVVSLSGQVLFQGTIQGESMVIPITNHRAGLYFIHLRKGASLVSLKGVVVR